MEHYYKVLILLENERVRNRIKRIISNRRFTIRTAKDLEEPFRYADAEEGKARIKLGRALVFSRSLNQFIFPAKIHPIAKIIGYIFCHVMASVGKFFIFSNIYDCSR